ncbi:MAG: hypothetical protein JOZ46_02125 [Candidatus Dormibacteraeota bacterium]|nr:hypothetical protein [Candidatus Dormibacteraeota bacterium]MBV9524593.1 hypothetical protein [Candidatus Dormibacteraeota bacterium]
MKAALAAVAMLLTGCATGAAASTTLSADPLHYLLTLNDMVSPDFTAGDAAHPVDASALAGGSQAVAQRLAGEGLQAAATVRYFRSVDLATSNGPVDVIDTAERFSSAAGAASSYASDVAVLDSASGAVPVSTGHLGDEAHAVSVVRATASGLAVVQITLEWRTANVVNVLVVRGRYGGTRLDDALTLASRIVTMER